MNKTTTNPNTIIKRLIFVEEFIPRMISYKFYRRDFALFNQFIAELREGTTGIVAVIRPLECDFEIPDVKPFGSLEYEEDMKKVEINQGNAYDPDMFQLDMSMNPNLIGA